MTHAALTLRLLSLGAGVQSTTLALMAAEGILPSLDVGAVDIRNACRRRTGPDGELLLCEQHAEIKYTADVDAGLAPTPRRKRPAGRARR